MRNADQETEVLVLKKLLEENQTKVLLPYSPAHIQDLLKGADIKENLTHIYKDLEYLDEISRQFCLMFDYEKGIVTPLIESSTELFKTYYEAKDDNIFDPEFYRKQLSGTIISGLDQILMLSWKHTYVDLGLETLANDKDAFDFYSAFFGRSMKRNTLYNFMLDLNDLFRKINSEPWVYNYITDLFREKTGLKKDKVSMQTRPIEFINQKLKDSEWQVDLDTLGGAFSGSENKLLNNQYMKFILDYVNLDMAGYHSDTMDNKKRKYANFSNDASHFFYAAHCDYLVTNDKKLARKSKVLYEKLGINTKVLGIKEFTDELPQILSGNQNLSTVFSLAREKIEAGEFEVVNADNADKTAFFKITLGKPFLYYFNVIYLNLDGQKKLNLYLNRKPGNLSVFTFYSEIEALAFNFQKLHGTVSSEDPVFDGKELEDIRSGSWQGKYWKGNDCNIFLGFDKYRTNLQLSVMQRDDSIKR
jgi:hypothetical protein